jgi:hypothetical protein
VTPATVLLVLVLFVAALALLFIVAKALKNWVFELSPGTWVATIVLTFSLGVLLAAYVDGNGTLILLGATPVAIAFVWWIVSAARRSSSRRAVEGAEG